MADLWIQAKRGQYPVWILEEMADCSVSILRQLGAGTMVIISNETVYPLYGHQLEAGLTSGGAHVHSLVISDGEEYKTIQTYVDLIRRVDQLGVTRDSTIIALGGGVIGDIAGFVAATILRGVRFVQVPTTLLAMVDSSVGGKTAVNTAQGKNRLGAFYPPDMVCMPLSSLRTLPTVELKSGLGEVIKHGILGSAQTLDLLETQSDRVLRCDTDVIKQMVLWSCQLKSNVVSEDELEKGHRAILNLGHTIGHAIEKVRNYGVLRHGECVALGLLVELKWSVHLGILEEQLPSRIEALLKKLDMSTKIEECTKEELFNAISYDKKRKNDKITVCVLSGVGNPSLLDLDFDELFRLCDEILEI